MDVVTAWDEFGQRLRAYVARRVAPGDADDIVQSVMLKLLERRGEIEDGHVPGWLATVTRNAVADYYRQRKPTVNLETTADLVQDDPDAADRTRAALSDCLDPMLRTLPPGDSELLRKVDLEGASQVELAALLGVPPSTLKSRVQRARTKLRTTFDTCCTIHRSRHGTPVDLECPPGESRRC